MISTVTNPLSAAVRRTEKGGVSALKKSTVFYLCSTMLLIGTILGFLISPAQSGGVSIGSNNRKYYGVPAGEGGKKS